MKASLRSVRIAPKKANLVAKMVRGMPVLDALESLGKTNKKAARIIEEVINSAVANAKANDNQSPDALKVKTLVVNKAQAYHRGVPMARGRIRRMRKFLSHITVTLGIDVDEDEKKSVAKPAAKKTVAKKDDKPASQSTKKAVKKGSSESKDAEPPKEDVSSKEEQASEASAESDSTKTS